MSGLPPAAVIEEYLPVMVPCLFAVESNMGDVDGVEWILECRVDERGFGTPLLWLSYEAADAWVKLSAEESGCYGGSRVVTFTLSYRHPAPVRCDQCGNWGHQENDTECPDRDSATEV